MYPYLITTDSGCDLSLAFCESIGVTPLKMTYTMDGRTETDAMTPEGNKAFYDKMRAGGMPSTSQVTPAQYLDFWRPLLSQGKPILHIAMGSGISGTYANGLTARDILRAEDPGVEIELIDSTLASGGYGLLVMRAAKLRDEGADLKTCARALEDMKGGVNAIYTTPDLTYLHRGGRVSRAGAVVGTVLNINPILNLDLAGHLQVFDKVRGEKGAKRKLISTVQELVEHPEDQTLLVCGSDAPERSHDFGDTIMDLIPFPDVMYSEIGTIIGTHTGPGLVAVFFEGKLREE